MSSSHNKTPLGGEASTLAGRAQQLTALYEGRLGLLPIWLHELDLERIVPLSACCIRIGMPLTRGDALEADDAERRAQSGRSIRRPSAEP